MKGVPFNKVYTPAGMFSALQHFVAPGADQTAADYVRLVQAQLSSMIPNAHVLPTTSCTHALEMAAMLLNIQQGDEVIMPSFTFVSSANPFVLRGAIPVFVDIRPDTLNIDPQCIEAAITPQTKAILAVHYAGVAADMDEINRIAQQFDLKVIEDAAHGMMATYKGKPLGSCSTVGCLSFDVSKNIHCYKGGALIVNDGHLFERAQIIINRGTNRADFDAGRSDYYTWMDTGSNYSMSQLTACYLNQQLLVADDILQHRLELWKRYYLNLNLVKTSLGFRIPEIPKDCAHNGHIFYLICNTKVLRDQLISYLASFSVVAAFHYIPLHSSPAGIRLGRFHGNDEITTAISETMVRLPLFHEMKLDEVDYICEKVTAFFNH